MQTKPNFVFFLTDDQPYNVLSCTGNPVLKTPNIDSLAAEGVLFEKAFVTTAICCCSRASIYMTDTYQAALRKTYAYTNRADAAVGEICRALKEQGLEQNTVVIHLLDNGSMDGAHGLRWRSI